MTAVGEVSMGRIECVPIQRAQRPPALSVQGGSAYTVRASSRGSSPSQSIPVRFVRRALLPLAAAVVSFTPLAAHAQGADGTARGRTMIVEVRERWTNARQQPGFT